MFFHENLLDNNTPYGISLFLAVSKFQTIFISGTALCISSETATCTPLWAYLSNATV